MAAEAARRMYLWNSQLAQRLADTLADPANRELFAAVLRRHPITAEELAAL